MGITLERCAQMRAEMDAGRRRDEVLAREGLAVDEWTVSQREWLDRMGSELVLGRYELTHRYTQAFLERQRVLSTMGGAVTMGGPESPPKPPSESPLGRPRPITGPPLHAAPSLPALPSFVSPGLAPPGRAAPAVDAPSPWATDPLPPPARDDGAPPGREHGEGESTVQPAPSPLAALPFRPASVSSMPAVVPPSRPVTLDAAGPKLGSTVSGAVSPFAAGAGALPFGPSAALAQSAPAVAAAPAASAKAAAAPPASGPKPSPALGATVMGTLSPFAALPSLPFAPSTSAPAAVPASTAATPFQPAAAPASPASTAATPFAPPRPAKPAAAPAAPPRPAAPVAAPAPVAPAAPVAAAPAPVATAPVAPAPVAPATPAAAATAPLLVGGLTLEQHASLCAEIAHAPARVNDVLARYRSSPEAKLEMDQAWKARFAPDPALERKWHEAYRLYFAFLSSARR